MVGWPSNFWSFSIMNLSLFIKKTFQRAFTEAFPEHRTLFWDNNDNPKNIEITQATQEKFGHYQCNSPMKLTKLIGVPPRVIAEKVVAALNATVEPIEIENPPNSGMKWSIKLISDSIKTEIAGPGFINITLTPEFLSEWITNQLYDKKLGVPPLNNPLKIIIDYSSPNVAKEMHVGHLRTTIIGDSLARLFRYLGHEVLALNHIGDWGTQFGMLIAYLKDTVPDLTKSAEGHPAPFKNTVGLTKLVQWYRAAKSRFDVDHEFKKQAQSEVVKLQTGDVLSLRLWNQICDISRKAYQEIYDVLDIRFLEERGESFYNPLLPKTIADLEKKGLITISDGAKCVFLEGFKNRNNEPLPLILQKADGAYNYATTDVTAIQHRIEKEKGDWIIYVVDAGQSQHLQMVFETAKKAGYCHRPLAPNGEVRLSHVEFGLVLRPDGKKFKTREGETERLIDLLNEAIHKAKGILKNKTPDLSSEEIEHSAKILGIDAVKYADLSCHRTSDYMFSYDKMLSFEGNTAAFLLYAYVRIQSIQQKIKEKDKNQESVLFIKNREKIILKDPHEISLGLLVCQFPEVLAQMADELLPNRLTDYLFRLSEKFHLFFHYCRVEGSAEQTSRLLLCYLVAEVLKQGLNILGLNTLKRM